MYYKKNGQFDENGKERIDKGNMIICPDGTKLTAENASEMDGYDGWQWFDGEFSESEVSDNSTPTSVTPSTWDRIKNWTAGLLG